MSERKLLKKVIRVESYTTSNPEANRYSDLWLNPSRVQELEVETDYGNGNVLSCVQMVDGKRHVLLGEPETIMRELYPDPTP